LTSFIEPLVASTLASVRVLLMPSEVQEKSMFKV